MKLRNILAVAALSGLVLMSAKGGDEEMKITDACKRNETIEKVKTEIIPFRYDKTTTTKVMFKGYKQSIQVAVPIFYDSKYKFVINTEGLPYGVKVTIYDKPKNISSSKILYEGAEGEKQIVFELPSTYDRTRIYVDYDIPASEKADTKEKGCIVLGAGYENI